VQAARLAMVLPNPKGRDAARPTAAQRARTARIVWTGRKPSALDGRADLFRRPMMTAAGLNPRPVHARKREAPQDRNPMNRLFHFPLSPFCRKVRLTLAEKRIEVELIEERYWEQGPTCWRATRPARCRCCGWATGC
jgi:hypothetical protein